MTLMDNPPVTMEDFFEASRGLWLNRRVVHHLDSQDDEAADSNLVIEPFNASDDAVEKVCKVFVKKGWSRCSSAIEETSSLSFSCSYDVSLESKVCFSSW